MLGDRPSSVISEHFHQPSLLFKMLKHFFLSLYGLYLGLQLPVCLCSVCPAFQGSCSSGSVQKAHTGSVRRRPAVPGVFSPTSQVYTSPALLARLEARFRIEVHVRQTLDLAESIMAVSFYV